MQPLHLPGPAPADFIWATGIEDTFVPQARPGTRPLDEYALMGHYEHWREDLALIRDLGVRAVRWGIPWYRVEPGPGQFDWSWIDQVLPYIVEDLGITPILDLMHYGTPLWLDRSFAGEEYPRAVARYARAVAERYRGLVRWYTPLNEPLINADYCGRRGIWPPYLRGDGGFLTVMSNIALGIVNTVEAIREVQPDALMVYVEAVGISQAEDEDLRALALEETMRRFLGFDLITGRVTSDHALRPWLLRNGVRLSTLRELVARHVSPECIGLNFYPQWSTRQIIQNRQGRVVNRITGRNGTGFAELINLYHARYSAPVMITETSAFGNHALRLRWLTRSLADIKMLRSRGIPVIGYTWFPLFTMVDWRYRTGKDPVERYYINLGLYTLRGGDDARWAATPLVDEFRRAAANPAESVGSLNLEAHGNHIS